MWSSSNRTDIEIAPAQDAITSIVKAYGQGVDDIESIMDKMVAVGNAFPISVSQIAEGMTNAGSTLKVAGNSIEQSIALLTAANTSVQNVNKASTGLRTIAARLRRSETELDELGETVTTAKYQQMVDMLTKHQVSLVDQNGELRDTYSIIQDIAGAWDSMTKNEQAALSEMAAGTRQQNIFTSMILNFREAEGAMAAMSSSTGALTTAYDIYLDSIQAHTGMFKASLQELGQTLFDSGMITDAIDAASDLVEALRPVAITIDKIVDSLGGAKGLLTLLAGGAIVKNIGAVAASVVQIGGIVKTLIAGGGWMKAFEAMAVKNAAGDVLVSGGIVAGIGAIAAVFTAVLVAAEAYRKKQEEIKKAAEETAQLETQRLDNWQKMTKRYSELKSKPVLSEEENAELQSMQAEIEASQGRINALIGEQAGQIDLVNGAYKEQLQLLKNITVEQAKVTVAAKKGDLSNVLDEYNDPYEAYRDEQSNKMTALFSLLDRIQNKTGVALSSLGIFEGDPYGLSHWLGSNSRVGNASQVRDVLNEALVSLTNSDDWRDIADTSLGFGHNSQEVMSSLVAATEYYNDLVDRARDGVTDLADALLTVASGAMTDPIKNMEDFNKARNDLIAELLKDNVVSQAWQDGIVDSVSLANSVDTVLASVAPDLFADYQASIKTGTEATMKEIVNTLPAMVGKSGMLSGIDEVTGNITKLYGWLDKINSGDFGTSDLFEMLDEFPSLQDAANGVNDLSTDLWKLADAVQGAINAAPDDLIARIDTYMDNHILSANVKAQLETWKEYLRGMTDLTNVTLPEKVAKIKDMQSAIYDAAGDTSGVTLEQYNALLKLNSRFADAVTISGNRVVVNTELAMDVVREMGAEYVTAINKQIAADRERIDALNALEQANGELTSAEAAERASLQQNIQRYQTLQGEILNTLSAYEQWRNAQNTANAGSEISDLESALEHINKVTNAQDKDSIFGQWNTDDFRTALALLGKDINDFMNGGTLDTSAVQKWYTDISKYFADGQEGVANFLNALADNDLATITDGFFQLADGLTLEDIASKMNLSVDAVRTLLEYATRYGLELDLVSEQAEGAAESISKVSSGGAAAAAAETQDSIDALNAISAENAGVARLIGLYRDLEDARDRGDQTDQQEFTAQINAAMSEPLDMDSVNAMREAINNVIQSLESEKAARIAIDPEIDTSDLDAQIASYTKDLNNIEAFVDVKVNQESEAQMNALRTTAQILAEEFKKSFAEGVSIPVDYSDVPNATSAIKELNEEASKIDGTHIITVKRNIVGGALSGLFGSSDGEKGSAGAYGGAFAGGTEALVGELGEEMVVDPANRYWYTVGKRGPEFVTLPKHAIVFNHKQTKDLLGRGNTNGRGTAYASGTAAASIMAAGVSGGFKATKALANSVNDIFKQIQNAAVTANGNLKQLLDSGTTAKKSDGGGGRGGGGSSSSGKSSSNKDNWFTKQYKENNHLIQMDKKSQSDYLKWLDGAYKKAYKERLIDADEYKKYQEEVYKGLQDVFMDSVDDMASKTEELANYNGAGQKIVAYYKQIISSVEKEIAKAYKNGLNDNSDYVQKLKETYWKYADALKSYQDDIIDDAKNAIEQLIRFRMKMISKELNDEKDNLKERLSDLKDFYDEQKKLLQDSADTEDYLKEQAEKRKEITNLEIQLEQLALDNSAKAQKKRLELEEQLADAREELYIFERDHAIEIMGDQFDNIYDMAEKDTDNRIETIDDMLEDQKYLYQTALEDLRNNNRQLYDEMIAYNEHYIDGTGDALVDMWDEAYEALYEYYALYKKAFEGIQLNNFTNWTPTDASVGTLKINGRKYAGGTDDATSGIHRIDEYGNEHVFVTANGNKYRLFRGGEKVLSAKATQFLYEFANSGGSIIGDALRRSSQAINAAGRAAASIGTVAMGDIIVQGDASSKTVSEIRRAQRESVDYLLKEFRKLNK